MASKAPARKAGDKCKAAAYHDGRSSPSLNSGAPARKALRVSSGATPSSRQAATPPSEAAAAASSAAASSAAASSAAKCKVPATANVPAKPPNFRTTSLLSKHSGIGHAEAYTKDEEQLNNFLKLHPVSASTRPHATLHKGVTPKHCAQMLSLEATSQRTLQLLSGIMHKVGISNPDLPVVPKSHDDLFLAPPNSQIGERPCINEGRCLAVFLAKLRHGANTPYSFVSKEFLLPSELKAFKEGHGLPARRKKCLLCARYFLNYVYILARTDPNFQVGKSTLGLQSFCNPVSSLPTSETGEEQALNESANELPTHCCEVNSRDGYHPSAMLFCDEDWLSVRNSRESRLGQLVFKPCVRFCSSHYRFVKDEAGLRILQVGIGANDSQTGLHFQPPPEPRAAAPVAEAHGLAQHKRR